MLTPRQKQILDFITNYNKRYGVSPALEEIKRHFRLKSVSNIHQHIEALKNKGYLNKVENQPRGIEVRKLIKLIQVPLLGLITAGQPLTIFENRETIAVPKSRVPSFGEIYALRVVGNSMVDENINDGDIILVRQQNVAENGQKVVALIDGSDTTLKKFYQEKNQIRLQPANKNIEPIIIKKEREFEIQGVFVDVIKTENPLPEILEKPIKTVKKYKKLPLNKIIYGNAVDVMKQMPDCSIDLTVTSPPYDELRNYNGYHFDFEGIAKNLFRITKKGAILVWVVGDKIKNGNRSLTSFNQLIFFQKIGFNVHDVMIYKKKNTPFMRTNAYTNCFEFMFILSKGKPKTFNPLKIKTIRHGREMLPFNKGADGINKKILGELKPKKTMTNIWEYAVGLYGTTSDKIAFKHPAVFPEKLAEDHILSWTKKGDIVFDPMCGSGTTCKMATKNSRFYIGCDISKEYVELAKKRLKNI